jgi:hypothetical protein
MSTELIERLSNFDSENLPFWDLLVPRGDPARSWHGQVGKHLAKTEKAEPVREKW